MFPLVLENLLKSRNDPFHHFAPDIGQAKVTPWELPPQCFLGGTIGKGIF